MTPCDLLDRTSGLQRASNPIVTFSLRDSGLAALTKRRALFSRRLGQNPPRCLGVAACHYLSLKRIEASQPARSAG